MAGTTVRDGPQDGDGSRAMSSSASEQLRGLALAVSGVSLISVDALLVRLIDIAPATLLFWRGMLSGAVLSIVLILFSAKTGACRAASPLPILGCASLSAAGSSFLVVSISLTTVGNVFVLMATAPLVAAVLSRLFLRETVAPRTWTALATALAGTLVIFSARIGGGTPWGDLSALTAAICFAAYLTGLRRYRFENLFVLVATSGFIMAGAALCMSRGIAVGAREFGLLMVLGGFVIPVSFVLFSRAPRYLPAAEVGLIMLLETVLAPLWVWLALDEIPEPQTFAGGALILTAVLLHALLGLREQLSGR